MQGFKQSTENESHDRKMIEGRKKAIRFLKRWRMREREERLTECVSQKTTGSRMPSSLKSV